MTFPPTEAPPPDETPAPSPPPAPTPASARDGGRGSRSLVVGLLAAAACSGAVLGFGVRMGMPARAFNAIAALVLGDAARGVWGWDSRVTPFGILLLAVVTFGWGLLNARLAADARGWRAVAWAVGVAAVAWLVSVVAVTQLGGEAARVLGPGSLIGLHLVLGVTLVVGMRFAFGGFVRDEDAAHRSDS